MKQVFNSTELRILGVLIEKSLTTPASYPLTINALVSGSNQQQNREPVMSLAEADVTRAVFRLQQYDVVAQAPPTANARSNRYQHCVSGEFNWDKREQAVMAELLLRGRQTAGELRNRAMRMTPIPDMQAIHAILADLINREPPFAKELQREPGRSTNRFQHLMSENEIVGVAESSDHKSDDSITIDSVVPNNDEISGRLITLEKSVEALLQRVSQLEKADASSLDGGDVDDV